MTNTLDLADFAALTPPDIERVCTDAMSECERAVAAICAVPDGARTFANTMLALEDATAHVARASGVYAFMGYVSADDAVRAIAREMDQKLDQYMVALSFREDLYLAIRAFADSDEARTLTGESARFLDRELRDYRRNGFDLAPAQRERVREIFDRLVALGTDFRNAIDDWRDGIEVTREELEGLPESFISGLQRARDKYRVSLDYPEMFPFLSNAENEAKRKELFLKDQRKGGPENVARLEEAVRLRHEAATLLGHDSWAAYVIEERMAKSRERVDSFLTGLRARLAPKGEQDLAAMRAARREHTGSDDVHIWDWRFYHNRRLQTGFDIDEFAVAEYFPLDGVLEGMFRTLEDMLGVRFTEAPEAPRWHPDVKAFDVRETPGGVPFARFYMDLFPRPSKFGHAAAFTLQRGRRLADGSYQRPVSAIVANFTRPVDERPSLLRHNEAETLWHEFGHILHQVLTRAERARFSGSATERDFVEAPSQMLEHWVWDARIVRTFARHYRTGEPIPDHLLARMYAARTLDSGIVYLRQSFFAALDLAMHSPAFHGDTTRLVEELHPITGFPFPEGTHFQSGFGHLFGYDAGYYGYLWSQVFGDDMWTRFAPDPWDRRVGREYRRLILERGASVDGDVMVREFLGREPDSAAFMAELGI